jgi:hypothetical protein
VNILVVVRAVIYATLFIGLVLVYVPGLLLGSASVRPVAFGLAQIFGMIVTATGTAIALWCVFTLVFVGKGTPAPFDPPRRLVIRGPYRLVRNPMYIGASATLVGVALLPARFSSPLIYSWCSTRRRRCAELSDQITKRIAGGLDAGCRREVGSKNGANGTRETEVQPAQSNMQTFLQ